MQTRFLKRGKILSVNKQLVSFADPVASAWDAGRIVFNRYGDKGIFCVLQERDDDIFAIIRKERRWKRRKGVKCLRVCGIGILLESPSRPLRRCYSGLRAMSRRVGRGKTGRRVGLPKTPLMNDLGRGLRRCERQVQAAGTARRADSVQAGA
jgi:hypothetical protein